MIMTVAAFQTFHVHMDFVAKHYRFGALGSIGQVTASDVFSNGTER
jgi:hypothetical protein